MNTRIHFTVSVVQLKRNQTPTYSFPGALRKQRAVAERKVAKLCVYKELRFGPTAA